MRLSKFLARATATASLILMLPTPSNAQRDSKIRNATPPPVQRSQSVVRDNRKAGFVAREAASATRPVRGVVNTTVKTGSGAKDLVTGRPIRGAKKLAGAAAGAAVAPVRTAVNAGSKVAGGAKKVGSAAKKTAQRIGKKLNPFD